ncbi:uncharacterized protein V6R79_005322 [Siganus canaliculatus]
MELEEGATSYLNCVLQVLFMTKEIHDRLTETQTDRALKELFNDLQNKTCGTETITHCLSISDVFKQRDAANCLEQILHHISEGASEEKSFQDFFQPETFTGNNKLLCDTCGNKTAAETRREMSKYPDILTLLLKTSDFDVRSDVKSKCPVKSETYELYGVVDHTGSLRAGHYTATILSSEDNMWYQFNDEHVSKLISELAQIIQFTFNSQVTVCNSCHPSFEKMQPSIPNLSCNGENWRVLKLRFQNCSP